jgi:[protein-PII] uridylyltransferase
MKQHGALFAAGALAYALLAGGQVRLGGRKMAWVAVGVAIPLALTAGTLAIAGSFERCWYWTVVYARRYAADVTAHDAIESADGAFMASARPPDAPPAKIGPYFVLEPIGEGGMGEVYLAEQIEPVRRRVAIKLLRTGFAGRDMMARFDVERQTLALLDHPNIARILDAGITEQGRPYVVVEHVPGQPLTRFADQRRLTIEQRLDLFLDICRSWGRVAPTLSAMHELGLLGRYLPEFGALTCLVQYDVYHKFTADQHSLIAVQNLEALAPGQSPDSEGNAQVVSELERPGLLMLGMLLHDIGKGKGHGHVAKGIPLAEELTARLGLEGEGAGAVVFLVAQHVALSHIAQRRDVNDPKTVEALAGLCGTPERLRMLYLLTVADMRAVGPGVMTGWQAQILWELYSGALTRLTGGKLERHSREDVTQRVCAELRDPGLRNAVPGHLAMVSDRYLTTTPPARIAAHLRLIERLEEGPVATELFHHRDLGSSDLVIITRDVPGLFSLIAGCLAANGINILSAQIHTRADGMAIDTFQVNDPFGEAVTEEARWRRTLQSLRRVLSGEQTVELLLAARRGGRPADEFVPGPAKVTVDNHLSDTHTVVEVKCPDRVGLLYLITRTLAHSGLSIASARIATDIDHAYDTFYVADRHGRRIEDAHEMMLVRSALDDALGKPL